MHDSWLLGLEPIVATSEGKLLYESAAGYKHVLSRGATKSICDMINPFKRRGAPEDYDYERLCLLTGPLSDAFAHWFHDYLPRLEGLEYYMEKTGNKPPVLISSDPPAWMLDSLIHLGYKEQDIIRWDDSIAAVKELIIPSLRSNCLINGPNEQKQIHRTGYSYRKEIIESVTESQTCSYSSNIIFINRKDAPTRRILNRSKLLSKLNIFNVNSVSMSNFPFSEQVAKMQNIDGIISPHGAGLLNMLWGDSIFVIEIFGNHVTAGMMSLANNINHDYYCISAEGEGKDIVVSDNHIQMIVKYISRYNDQH
jgi:capsular polysaccharide biosynthesis protein